MVDVVDRLLVGVDDAHGEDQRQELLGPVGLGGRRDRRVDLDHARIAAQLDAALAQRRERARQEGGGDVAVHEQRLGRVAHARPLDLGVDDDPLGHREIGGRVDVDVAVARGGVDHGHAGDGADRLLQALAAARDDQVDDALELRELGELLAAAAGHERERALRAAPRPRRPRARSAPARRWSARPTRSRAAAPRCRTSGTARRRRSSRSGAPRRRPRSRPAGLEPCGTRARWPGGRRRRPRRPDPGSAAIARVPSAIPRMRASSSARRSISAVERPGLATGLEVARVGLEDLRRPRLQRVGDREQRRVLGRRVDRGQPSRGGLGGERQVGDGRGRASGGGGHGESLGSRGRMTTILRARVAHTPRDPFERDDALETFDDGAVAFDGEHDRRDRRVRPSSGADHADAEVLDRRDCILLPGFVDTHVHFPQIAVIGAMGLQLLDWLAQRTLPEEARMADAAHARRTAERFVRAPGAQRDDLRARLRRALPGRAGGAVRGGRAAPGCGSPAGSSSRTATCAPTSRSRPMQAYERASRCAIAGTAAGACATRSRRASRVSCTEAMLDACRALLDDGVLFTSHVNESPGEIDVRARAVPAGARLPRHLRARRAAGRVLGARAQRPRLRRRARAARGVANRGRALPVVERLPGLGIFPMARHVEHGVRFGMGTDVGAGTGLEHAQGGPRRLPRADGARPGPHARPGATCCGWRRRREREAIGLGDTCGDLHARQGGGLRAAASRPTGSTLEAVLEEAPDWNAALGAVFTLAREESVVEAASAARSCSRERSRRGRSSPGGRPLRSRAAAPRAPRRTSGPSRGAARAAE